MGWADGVVKCPPIAVMMASPAQLSHLLVCDFRYIIMFVYPRATIIILRPDPPARTRSPPIYWIICYYSTFGRELLIAILHDSLYLGACSCFQLYFC